MEIALGRGCLCTHGRCREKGYSLFTNQIKFILIYLVIFRVLNGTFFEEKSKRATIIRWILGNPWKTLAISFLVLGLMAPQMKNIDADFSYRTWFRDGDVLLNEFDAFERRFGNDDAIVVVVHSENGVFDIESTELLNNLTADMWQVNEVIRVDSLSNYNWVYGEGDSIIVEPLLEPAPGVELTNEFYKPENRLL